MSLLLAGGAAGPVNYVLACDAGAYVYTGQAAALSVARNLPLAVGAYAYTGQAATFVVGRRLSLAAGAYTYTGLAAVLTVDRLLALATDAYNYVGQDAVLDYIPGAVIPATVGGSGQVVYVKRKFKKTPLEEIIAHLGEKETPLFDAAKEVIAEEPQTVLQLHVARRAAELRRDAKVAARLLRERAIELDDEEVLLLAA